MGVRLNKVLSELNIGLQTAVDFLKKKPELGEVKDDVSPNTKISDAQYQALVDQFSSDKAVKTQAEKLFVKKPKEKKPEKVVIKAEELLEQRPQFKPVGKINLDEINKPKAAPVEETKPEPVVAAVTPEPEPEPEPKIAEPVVEVEETPEVVEEPVQEQVEEPSTLAKTPGDFIKPATQLNVVGKIDLDALNQSTRPKKKRHQLLMLLSSAML